ncbi:MAG: hypothetical protein ACI9Y1_001600 [Lentisphaeria bacterium]|jgi:hypothetical protein
MKNRKNKRHKPSTKKSTNPAQKSPNGIKMDTQRAASQARESARGKKDLVAVTDQNQTEL